MKRLISTWGQLTKHPTPLTIVCYLANINSMISAYDSTSKRIEILRSAKELIYEQGYAPTTLAHVANRAQVALGNLHYYFASKQSLAEAVIASHVNDLLGLFAGFDALTSDPEERLKRLIREPLANSRSIIQFGCPHGSLCQELEKLGLESPLAKAGAQLLTVYEDWANKQFLSLGFETVEAWTHAGQLIASLQGAMLLSSTHRSTDLLQRQLHQVEAWLEREIDQQRRREYHE